jgi:cation diffusion facilitator CzcD-associated flavoprotein CzcO
MDRNAPVRTDEPAPPAASIEALIVGAGPAGLAVGACLRRAGVPFLILEAGEHVGTSWHTRYDRLHLHTVKRYSALPFMPFPQSAPRYPSRQEVIDYLDAYAERFELRPILGRPVTCARREGGEWRVETPAGEYRSRALIICTGVNREPIVPRWRGDEDFHGSILHSAEYRNAERFLGQRVLVIGMGNTGAEIALDLAEAGVATTIAVRGGVNIVPRDPLGVPIQVLSIFAPSARPQTSDLLMRPLWRRLIGDLRPLGLSTPPYGPTTSASKLGKIPVIDVGTVRLLREQRIGVRGAIDRFTADGVRFGDGRQERFDAVVLATGYHPGLHSFLPEAAAVTDAKGYPRASGRRTALPGLYFCGFRIVSTGLLREIGREAARITRDLR